MGDLVIQEQPLTPAEIRGHVDLITNMMREVMKDEEHYGVIPGCGKKPALLKAGAEKLILTFRLAPRVSSQEIIDLGNNHREVRTRISLYHQTTERFLGEGVGSCNTMESKYRFRTGAKEVTDREVPKEYWNLRKQDADKAEKLIGTGNGTKKDPKSGKWYITSGGGSKVEHDNPADYYNTVEKMSYKRALVSAVLSVTAASDIFTQDIEENPEMYGGKTPPVKTEPVKEQERHSEFRENSTPKEETETKELSETKVPEDKGQALTPPQQLLKEILIMSGCIKADAAEMLGEITEFDGKDGKVSMQLDSLIDGKVKAPWAGRSLKKIDDLSVQPLPEGCTEDHLSCPEVAKELGSGGVIATCHMVDDPVPCPFAVGLFFD